MYVLLSLIALDLPLSGFQDFLALIWQLLVAAYPLDFMDELEPVLLFHVRVSVGMGDLKGALAQLRVYSNPSACEVAG